MYSTCTIYHHTCTVMYVTSCQTRVLVTHGLSYLPQCDQIIVLSHGRVSEVGSYRQLLEMGQDFAEVLKTYMVEEDVKSLSEHGTSDGVVGDCKRSAFVLHNLHLSLCICLQL